MKGKKVITQKKQKIPEVELEITPEFQKAFELMEHSSKHVFITGKAGTGKSTLLTYFRNRTKKKVVVLAPTGVAALNVKGQTIHSFFRFRPTTTLRDIKKVRNPQKAKIYKTIDAIVIDEISMVRADLLDCADRFMRLNGSKPTLPFGGAQMIFIGDLYQLSPVVTSQEREIFKVYYTSPYFFAARAFDSLRMEFIELEKIYRQKDQKFIDILNAIRNRSVTDQHLGLLNTCLSPSFQPSPDTFYIYLTPTNKAADEVNEKELGKLPGKVFTYEGRSEGAFDTKALPTEITLSVKIGAQVMMLNNDAAGRWVNGSVGKIIGILTGKARKVLTEGQVLTGEARKVLPEGQVLKEEDEEENDVIVVELSSGKKVKVSPYTWELFRFSYDETSGTVVSEITGTFTQYPLMLAWAVTIHKSQGKTFERVIVDMGRGAFAHGQTYVALSRCTTFEGLILKKPIEKKHIFMDWRVVKFITQYQYQLAQKTLSLEEKMRIIQDAITNNASLEILYLKSNDEKSRRTIKPHFVGKMEYAGKTYIGIDAFDSKRQEQRNFRVDRILEIKVPFAD